MANNQTIRAQRYLEAYQLLLVHQEALRAARDQLQELALQAGRKPEDPVPGKDAIQENLEHIGEAIAIRMVLIAQIEDEQQNLVLTMRYINGLTWPDIQRRLKYGQSQVFRFHQAALASFTTLMNQTS
jgi:DNA-directed RNA polymerase specialized sigma subunit